MLKDDLPKLILRFLVAGLLLPHGIHKVITGHGFIIKTLKEHGLPTFLWVGVPVAEVLAPILLILGIFTRAANLLIIATMMFVIGMVFGIRIFDLNDYGGFSGEVILFYIFAALTSLLLGPGKIRIYQGEQKYLV
ncbi:DoxX family protein [Pedobacter sp. AW1-32]|uniref:DoxX family protein n=1 Tax=Pedobacter sp. AW1-32 TaxID=3383026 RepID=UPI003FEEB93A